MNDWLKPDWPAPENVHAVCTTRSGGVSVAPFDSLNLGDHVGDTPIAVARNRQLVAEVLDLPNTPFWLQQVHGVKVAQQNVDNLGCSADASVSFKMNEVCVVMTADCLPVLFCNRAGTRVAAAHAGWRGLCDGVLEKTVGALDCDPAEILAWMGPAIGPKAFEVGDEVRAAFMEYEQQAAQAFQATQAGKWLADIYQLGRQRLSAMGVTAIYGGELCTYTQQDLFFSFRRDQQTGRMASLVWLS
ncbi:peptidoglycan editing factor PgeF [uncultured Thiothrix sp.]|uniref:peptidoglycan editing factor PgeF n=1 Tax=uncultured Thiothrix sp. TaxID=223185 RepID=UPI0026372C9E|nr:peptidoglycan editing factor PgeF [uncultured Thiothrix sp.]HMT94801.1 peptidoglycan editing factor PgeF [Thiolinea sp.]